MPRHEDFDWFMQSGSQAFERHMAKEREKVATQAVWEAMRGPARWNAERGFCSDHEACENMPCACAELFAKAALKACNIL